VEVPSTFCWNESAWLLFRLVHLLSQFQQNTEVRAVDAHHHHVVPRTQANGNLIRFTDDQYFAVHVQLSSLRLDLNDSNDAKFHEPDQD